MSGPLIGFDDDKGILVYQIRTLSGTLVTRFSRTPSHSFIQFPSQRKPVLSDHFIERQRSVKTGYCLMLDKNYADSFLKELSAILLFCIKVFTFACPNYGYCPK